MISCHLFHCIIFPLICPSVHLSAHTPKPPCCFPASPPWTTWTTCLRIFPKPANALVPNCAKCTAWTCPTPRRTAEAASCPGAHNKQLIILFITFILTLHTPFIYYYLYLIILYFVILFIYILFIM